MKKIFTLCFMAIALMASANTYTLSQLAELVPALEDGTGVAVVDGAYVVNLPTSLPDGVSGLGYDDNNIVLTKTYFTINGDLIISEGETLLFGGSTSMEINGNLTITGATIGAAEGSEAKAKGFRMYQEGVSATITNSTFNYVGINYGNGTEEGCLTVTGCTFNNHNSKGGNAVINFTSLSKGNLVQDCEFNDPTLSAVASGANVACGITIKDNVINKPTASSRLYPGINMSATGPYDIVIDGNEVHGPADITRAGGIALACLLGNPPTGTLYVTNNFVENCSYGITLTGPGNVRMINNTVLNNKYISDPNNGGSGLNITCNSSGVIAKAYMQGNHIEGNLWGVTVIGNVDINAGYVEESREMEYNPGENVFKNNGNGDPFVKYDWYNYTTATSYAQGNTWNVEVQDFDHIAEVVYDQADNPSFGEVIYMPAAEQPVEYNEFYLVGTFNGWSQVDGMITFEGNEEGTEYTATVDLEANAEFKVITPAGEGEWKWFGGVDDNQVGYFLINDEIEEIALIDGANFKVEEAGNFTFTIMEAAKAVSEPLIMTVTKNEPEAIETITTNKQDNNWYNLQGVKFNGMPSIPGVYINNGKKVVIK
ncbi:MAG: SusF/SusE family outer membrane protein [Muribaculaceae bacterium]|nr:SusF/SusE family outer membrane protein [Muribaculaceae bacterium]